ncbi:MAG: BACON domain-containing protein, partial [Planctomycetota bacterium]
MNDAHPLIIGGFWEYCDTDSFYNRLNGIADDVRIYNRALSAGEIQQVYGEGTGSPFMGLSALEFEFIAPKGGPNPAPQILSIRNMGADTLNWQITEDCSWLEVMPNGGQSTGEVNEVAISVNVAGLPVQAYHCQLTLSDPNAQNSPQIVDVYLMVQMPMIELSSQQFDFTAPAGGPNPAAQTLSIRNSGLGSLNWQITEDCPWASATPNSGQSVGQWNNVSLAVDTNGMEPGEYLCELVITDPCAMNDPQTVYLGLSVREPAVLVVPSEYPTIQAAIDAAIDRDTVIIAPGTYTGPGNKNLDFKGKAITVRSTDPNDPCVVAATVIDCQNSGRGFYFHTSEGPNSVLEGLTITNGCPGGSGGGIYCYYSSPTISACVITGNCTSQDTFEASYHGGGISVLRASPIIERCTIVGNIAADGGGVASWDANITVTDCVIKGNRARGFDYLFEEWYYWEGGNGGGLYSYGYRDAYTLTLVNCVITGNEADVLSQPNGYNHGGGIYCWWSTTIFNCLIADNTAPSYGSEGGGGIYCGRGPLMIRNCTITGNRSVPEVAGQGIYGGNGTLLNSIVWDNGIAGGAFDITYSDVSGGWPGVGNIDAGPLFADASGGDYHLLVGSPCINAGDPTYDPTSGETDIDGEPRMMGLRVDMGADEFPVDQAFLEVVPTQLDFFARLAGPNPPSQILSIRNTGTGTLNWQ